MQLSKAFSVASMTATCALLIGGLYAGCSNDDVEENYDEQITTLADESMTRAGEGSSTPNSQTIVSSHYYYKTEWLWGGYENKDLHFFVFDRSAGVNSTYGPYLAWKHYSVKVSVEVGYVEDTTSTSHRRKLYSALTWQPGYNELDFKITGTFTDCVTYKVTHCSTGDENLGSDTNSGTYVLTGSVSNK